MSNDQNMKCLEGTKVCFNCSAVSGVLPRVIWFPGSSCLTLRIWLLSDVPRARWTVLSERPWWWGVGRGGDVCQASIYLQRKAHSPPPVCQSEGIRSILTGTRPCLSRALNSLLTFRKKKGFSRGAASSRVYPEYS